MVPEYSDMPSRVMGCQKQFSPPADAVYKRQFLPAHYTVVTILVFN